MAKATKNEDVPLIDGIENSVIDKELQNIVENSVSGMTLEQAKDEFVKSLGHPYVKMRLKTPDAILDYAVKSVISVDMASKSFSSKPTTTISCVIRNVSNIVSNSCNVTEETRGLPDEQKVGIAGSWRKCKSCGKIWDTADLRYGDSCPGCSSLNTVILAEQAAPEGTKGVVNRKDMNKGNIAVFNTRTTGVFVFNGETYEPAYLKFIGKEMSLLKSVRCGIPFDININEKVFTSEVTGEKWYETTGTSKILPVSMEFDDIINIYEQLSDPEVTNRPVVKPLIDVKDKDYCALFLSVVTEPEQPKDKWLVKLVDPDSQEPEIVSMYLEDESVAKQFNAGDIGVFECRYTESLRSVEGKTEKAMTINVNTEPCGVPIYLMTEKGTRFIIS